MDALVIWKGRMEERVSALEYHIAALVQRAEPVYGRKFLRQLYQTLSEHDVREIAFSMFLDEDNLEGDTKDARIISLVQWARRMNRMAELLQLLREMRPQVNWPEGDSDDYLS